MLGILNVIYTQYSPLFGDLFALHTEDGKGILTEDGLYTLIMESA